MANNSVRANAFACDPDLYDLKRFGGFGEFVPFFELGRKFECIVRLQRFPNLVVYLLDIDGMGRVAIRKYDHYLVSDAGLHPVSHVVVAVVPKEEEEVLRSAFRKFTGHDSVFLGFRRLEVRRTLRRSLPCEHLFTYACRCKYVCISCTGVCTGSVQWSIQIFVRMPVQKPYKAAVVQIPNMFITVAAHTFRSIQPHTHAQQAESPSSSPSPAAGSVDLAFRHASTGPSLFQ